MKTSIEVPRNLKTLTRKELRALRDRLIAAGAKEGGIDDRLEAVVVALRRAKDRTPQQERRLETEKKRKDFRFGSLGSVAGDKLRKIRKQTPKK